MARPSKAADEKRDQRFNLRFTLAEIEFVRAQAHAAGLDPHEYLRRRSLGHVVVPSPARRSDPALVSELNRIGVNVNQLARTGHTDRAMPMYWREVGNELSAVLRKVLQADGA